MLEEAVSMKIVSWFRRRCDYPFFFVFWPTAKNYWKILVPLLLLIASLSSILTLRRITAEERNSMDVCFFFSNYVSCLSDRNDVVWSSSLVWTRGRVVSDKLFETIVVTPNARTLEKNFLSPFFLSLEVSKCAHFLVHFAFALLSVHTMSIRRATEEEKLAVPRWIHSLGGGCILDLLLLPSSLLSLFPRFYWLPLRLFWRI